MNEVKQLVWETRATHSGGVPKFAWYLQRAVGGLVYSMNDMKDWDNSIPVVDGNLSRFITQTPIVSVVHGTWKEFALRNGNPPFTNGEVTEQHRQWNREGVHCVAVSHSASRQLKEHHGVVAERVILNCVDENVYIPKKPNNIKPVIIYAANDGNKEGQKLSAAAEYLKDTFEFRYLNAKIGEEPSKFVEGDLYVHSSNYEGNSFAVLEAMSCNLPIIGTACGLLEDIDEKEIGGIVPWNASGRVLADKILEVYEKRNEFNPREWVLKNATFEMFKQQWSEYLEKFR